MDLITGKSYVLTPCWYHLRSKAFSFRFLFHGQGLVVETHVASNPVPNVSFKKLLRFEQPPPSTLTSLRPSNSTCLRTDLENSNIGSVNKSQAPSKHKPDGGLNEVAYSQPKATQKLPFPISRKTRGQPHCAPGGTLSKTRLASFSGGTLAGSTGE